MQAVAVDMEWVVCPFCHSERVEVFTYAGCSVWSHDGDISHCKQCHATGLFDESKRCFHWAVEAEALCPDGEVETISMVELDSRLAGLRADIDLEDAAHSTSIALDIERDARVFWPLLWRNGLTSSQLAQHNNPKVRAVVAEKGFCLSELSRDINSWVRYIAQVESRCQHD